MAAQRPAGIIILYANPGKRRWWPGLRWMWDNGKKWAYLLEHLEVECYGSPCSEPEEGKVGDERDRPRMTCPGFCFKRLSG